MEENCSEDLGVDIIRIYDVNPTEQWPLPSINIVLGGYPMMRMPFVEDNRQRPYLKDGQAPITWFVTVGSIRDQKNVLVFKILPFLLEMGSTGGEILWCPCPEGADEANFRQDCFEVLDAFEKLEEFNFRFKMSFKMGLA